MKKFALLGVSALILTGAACITANANPLKDLDITEISEGGESNGGTSGGGD